MCSLRKLVQLPFADQRLLLAAGAWIVAIRLGLWVLPFSSLRRLLAWSARLPAARLAGQPAPTRVVWAVAAASRCVPRATCLTQALATQLLLARRRHPTLLRIGVAKNDQNRFEAHAWVESDGQVLIGRLHDLPRYTPLVSFEHSPGQRS